MQPCLSVDADGVPFIQIGQHVLRLDLEDLDDYYKERAQNELRETPEIVQSSLEELRKLIQDEEDLNLPMDNDYLLKFLRPCKFYADSAFRLIRRYYKFLAKNTKYTANLMPSTVEVVYQKEILEFLPFRVKGSRVMILNVANWNPNEIEVSLLFKAVIMGMEIAMIEPRTQVGGVHVILDVEGLTINHVLKFSPMLAKLIIDFIQECTAIRLKGIHIVNQPYIFNMGYAIFKPFIGQKLKERLFFHGKKRDEIFDAIPKDFLPERYGGTYTNQTGIGLLLVEILKHYESDYEQLTHYGYSKGEIQKI